MNEKEFDQHVKLVIETFNRGIWHELDRKQRLGHYAVVMENGKITRLSPARIRKLLKDNPLPDTPKPPAKRKT